ncbi:DNA polymerase III psi subunit [Volucribacter psittacicida]|uniref:DNA polymerase III subunit psi n=1 Tax=Volucribacter psittacicida TaxID=203482 RepID=A0A4R1G7G0_9PAST|nr:DNA polymerase III subunit psi [Volucribacter psittacicida]TCK01569.1 DNA polymerase III psi subunit [Volucribacter psittacicida]
MNHRRDILLQQMGITQWKLQRPEVFKGAIQMNIAENIRLVIISDQAIAKSAVLLQDILRAINIAAQDCQLIAFSNFAHLSIKPDRIYWLLSDDPQQIQQAQSLCQQATALWQSPSWQTFRQNAQAKKQLWQSIYQSLTDDE